MSFELSSWYGEILDLLMFFEKFSILCSNKTCSHTCGNSMPFHTLFLYLNSLIFVTPLLFVVFMFKRR